MSANFDVRLVAFNLFYEKLGIVMGHDLRKSLFVLTGKYDEEDDFDEK